MDEPIATKRVVVGVTGSPNSAAALARATYEAQQRQAELYIFKIIDETEDAQHALSELKSFVHRSLPPEMSSRTRTCIEYGEPGRALVKLSQGADLLVIGARANSDRLGIFSGDIVSYCAHHAPCPIYICADHGTERPAEQESIQ